jgi:hypothetical protein
MMFGFVLCNPKNSTEKHAPALATVPPKTAVPATNNLQQSFLNLGTAGRAKI